MLYVIVHTRALAKPQHVASMRWPPVSLTPPIIPIIDFIKQFSNISSGLGKKNMKMKPSDIFRINPQWVNLHIHNIAIDLYIMAASI